MSGLEDLYREIILDHYRSPRNRGELPVPPAHRAEGFNPLCGDEVIVYLQLDGDTVQDLQIGGQGCSISQSSASMMSAAVKGKTVADVRRIIGSFKSMMSIHTQTIGGEADDDDEEKINGADALSADDLGELAALQGVVKFPVRIKCATLSWNTLAQGLDEVAAGVSADR
jgi:nitrogen fixation NifU-like protein